jgi:hypothetical protein
MSRIIAVAAFGLMAATVVFWPTFFHVKPQATATVAKAEAAERPPMISPFDIMIKHGKNLPIEKWRDAF